MEFDLIIIGAGPGGYVAAIRAGQTGLKTAIIEKSTVGGMCLNWGCIPTKSLLESAKRFLHVKNAEEFGVDGIDKEKLTFNWKTAVKRTNRIVKRLTKGVEFLLKKNNVTLITGSATINSDKTVSVDNVTYTAKNIIIATGSDTIPLKVSLPLDVLVPVSQLLKLENIPDRMVVLGNGPHAVELAQFFALAGKNAVLISPEKVLIPQADPFLSEYGVKILKKSGVDVRMETEISGYDEGYLLLTNGEKVSCEKVIDASERVAVLPPMDINLKVSNGFVEVNDHLETSIPGIFAVGDVNGKSIFAHAASAQGLYVIDRIHGIYHDAHFDVSQYPINIYTYPEMAQIGLSEPQVEKMKKLYKVGEFPLTANGKALTEGETEGLVRVLSDKKYGEVLGVHIIAQNATDMIAEASLLIQMEGTVYDIAATIHAHPTISEIFMEAGFDSFDQAIHK